MCSPRCSVGLCGRVKCEVALQSHVRLEHEKALSVRSAKGLCCNPALEAGLCIV